MALTSEQLKARIDLARRQSSIGLTPTKFKTGTTVTKPGVKQKIADDAMKNQQRIFKKRQACEAKGGTFDPVRETCSMGITEKLTTPRESFRAKGPTKEQEALNLIARGDISQAEGLNLSGIEDPTTVLSALTGAKALEEKTKQTELERKIEATKASAEFKAKQKAIEAAGPGLEVGAEAPTLALARGKEGILTEKANIIEEEFAINKQALAEKQTELQQALRTGRVDLVRQARASILDLRKSELNLKAQATSDVLETMGDTILGKTEDELSQIALDQNVDLGLLKLQQEKLQLKDKTAEAKTKIATTKASDTKVKSALDTGLLTGWSSEELTKFAEGSSYTPGELALLAKQKEEILSMKKDDPLLAEKKRKYNAEIAKIEAQTLLELGTTEPEIKTTPTGVQESITMTDGRTINIDSVGKESLVTINESLGAEGLRLGSVATSGARSVEQQQRLYGQGRTREELIAMGINGDFAQPNKPVVTNADGVQSKSLHQTGVAIDLFPDKTYIERVRPTLEANGWFQDAALVDKGDVGHFEFKGVGANQEVTQFDIANFNNSTFKPQKDLKTASDKAKYIAFLSKRKEVLSNPDPLLEDILEISEGGKDLTDSSINKLDKFGGVLSGAGDLLATIEEVNKGFFGTGPISGAIASLDPFNTPAQTLKRQLIALIPGLARGVYGEVGVLTDNDVKLYASTLPGLTQTEDVNKAVLGITLRTIQRSYQNALKTQAAAGRDVSGFSGAYQAIEAQVKAIEEELGMTEKAVRLEAEDLANKFDPELSSIMNKFKLK